ncbi:MAG TPA: pyridoxamine 5'-phosphate oxidase family protein [Trebonia sp.]|nr:pyridoxamine 5'-phosphate oxidase family protein [Trebonia sp.]
MPDRVLEELDEPTCLELISRGGIGRIGYTASQFGLVILPVNYALHEGAVVLRTVEHGPLDEELRTGIQGAEQKVAFEIDEFDLAKRVGWSVLIQGPAHHVTGDEWGTVVQAAVQPIAPGKRELFIRIVPSRITGRRISPA